MRNQVVVWMFALAGCIALALRPAVACDVPVFRYALERWETDRYQAVVFFRGALSGKEKGLLDGLRSYADTREANCDVVAVDLDNQPSKSSQLLWEAQQDARLPWVVLRAPRDVDERSHVWAGPLAQAGYLLNSPARQQIVRRISDGDSVVWVLLESGDHRRDAAATELLQAQLPQLERTLALPEMGDVTVRGGRALAPVPPLKLAFSTVHVVPDDAREGIFADVLRHSDPRLRAVGPVVFAVFGRGRSLVGLTGDDLTADMLRQVAEYLIGPCACIVKESNPGNDLLLAAGWDALIQQGVVEDPPLPSFAELPSAPGAALVQRPAVARKTKAKPPVKAVAQPKQVAPPVAAAPGPVAAEAASAVVVPPATEVVVPPPVDAPSPATPAGTPAVRSILFRNALFASLAGLALSVLVVGLLVRRMRKGR